MNTFLIGGFVMKKVLTFVMLLMLLVLVLLDAL